MALSYRQLNTKSCQGTDLNTEIQQFVYQQMIWKENHLPSIMTIELNCFEGFQTKRTNIGQCNLI